MPSLAEDLTLALELADLADTMTMDRFRAADLKVETKPDLTPVSEADQACERALRERLAAERPEDAVVGEEYGVTNDGASRRWILDPIDGTKSYVRGMATWSTLIALQVDAESVLGVVSMPAIGHRWWATRGGGAFSSGRRLQVSGVSELSDAQLVWSGLEDWDAIGRGDNLVSLIRRCWRTRGVGDAWQYMLVAEGAAEIATDPEAALWDLAPLKVIVEEAGGRFTNLAGERTVDGGSGVATNGLVHDEVLSILGG